MILSTFSAGLTRKPSQFKEALNRNSNKNRYSEVNSHIALCHERLSEQNRATLMRCRREMGNGCSENGCGGCKRRKTTTLKVNAVESRAYFSAKCMDFFKWYYECSAHVAAYRRGTFNKRTAFAINCLASILESPSRML